jgi:CO dehydrogenase maturation factor
MRSVETAAAIRESADKFTQYKKLNLILNRVKGNTNQIKKKLKDLNLPLLGEIPDDANISEFELKGKPIIDLPENSKSYIVINKLVQSILNI